MTTYNLAYYWLQQLGRKFYRGARHKDPQIYRNKKEALKERTKRQRWADLDKRATQEFVVVKRIEEEIS